MAHLAFSLYPEQTSDMNAYKHLFHLTLNKNETALLCKIKDPSLVDEAVSVLKVGVNFNIRSGLYRREGHTTLTNPFFYRSIHDLIV